MEGWARWFEFDTCGDVELTQMLSAAAQLVLEMKSGGSPRWLSLSAKPGAGKTHLCRRVWRWWEETGKWYVDISGATLVHRGQWVSWRKFAAELLGGDFSRIADLCTEQFVVLDDIGSTRDTSKIGLEVLAEILDARLGKWTMISSNYGLKEIASRFDARIVSRMLRGGSRVVDVAGVDYALRKRR